MAKVIKDPKLKCDECRWDAIAMAIAMAAGKPEEFVSGCKVHKKINTAIRESKTEEKPGNGRKEA